MDGADERTSKRRPWPWIRKPLWWPSTGSVLVHAAAASGDFTSAASDRRGFVKAELAKPGVALLDAPGLQDTPALAKHCSIQAESQAAARCRGKDGCGQTDDSKSGAAISDPAKTDAMASADPMSPIADAACEVAAAQRGPETYLG